MSGAERCYENPAFVHLSADALRSLSQELAKAAQIIGEKMLADHPTRMVVSACAERIASLVSDIDERVYPLHCRKFYDLVNRSYGGKSDALEELRAFLVEHVDTIAASAKSES